MGGKSLLGGLVLMAAAVLAMAGAAAAQESDGAAVYQTNCSTCHGPQGAGQLGLFPPLAGNTNVLDEAYVRSVIINGRQGEIVVNGVTYNGVMPGVGANLPSEQVDAVVAFVTGELQAQAPVTTTTSCPGPGTTVPAGGEDATRGQELFLGAASFENDGPACMACHSTGAAGAPKVGDAVAWADRIAKGNEVLYLSGVNGVPGTGMIAKGGCVSCSDEEIHAAVDFMVAGSQ